MSSQKSSEHPAQAPDHEAERPARPPELVSRRGFLTGLSAALMAAAAGLVGVPFLGFLVSPLIKKPPRTWRSVGKVEDFKIGATVEVTFLDATPLPWTGVAARTGAWLRRESETEFRAFSVNCTHLGCPVKWLPQADLFMCPCHGGVYYPNGNVAAGPPPKPLGQYPVRVRNGVVDVLTSPIPIA